MILFLFLVNYLPQFSNIRSSSKPNRKESAVKQPRVAQKQYVTDDSNEALEEYERSLEAKLTDQEVVAAFDRMLVRIFCSFSYFSLRLPSHLIQNPILYWLMKYRWMQWKLVL